MNNTKSTVKAVTKSINPVKNYDYYIASKSYQFFNSTFLITVGIALLGTGIMNIAIDPFGVFQIPKIQGFTQDKPGKRDNDRIFKTADIIYTQPKTIIIGSSRVRQGIDPAHPALLNKPSYNLGLNGINAYEQLRYLRHAIANQQDLKVVVLEVDLFMFNGALKTQTAFDAKRLEKNHLTLKDIIDTTLSWNAIQASYQTLVHSFEDRNDPATANYGDNGFLPYRNVNKEGTQGRFKASINQYLEFHNKYQLSQQFIEDFKQLVELCREKNITLKVFISPAHATQSEVIRLTGQGQTYENWKRQIVNIIPIWDFSGFNSITTAKINNKMDKYSDNSHFLPFVGAFILDRLFSYQPDKVPQDFGVWLTPNNIEAHLQKTRRDREKWVKDHPDEVELVKQIKNEFDRLHPSSEK
jgi:hypothetical protein